MRFGEWIESCTTLPGQISIREAKKAVGSATEGGWTRRGAEQRRSTLMLMLVLVLMLGNAMMSC